MSRVTKKLNLNRVRPPRVHLAYDVEIGGAIELKELPFVLGVLSALYGQPDEPLPALRNRKFVEIDLDNFNQVMAGFRPCLAFTVDNLLLDADGPLNVELGFRQIEDFEPAQVVGQVKPLADLLELRKRLAKQASESDADPDAPDYSSQIRSIDELLSRQLSLIMHAAQFQTLEASWRGLYYLVSETSSGTMLRIKVLGVSKEELLKDFERAAEVEQSALFKKVYEEEYGTFGGLPYGALIGDYEFGKDPRDIALLRYVSEVAAIAHAPFIAAPGPSLFGWDSFDQMAGVRDVSKIFDRAECAGWRSFRESPNSKYVGLTIPRMLMRLPYGDNGRIVEAFRFEEDLDQSGKNFLWANAAYAYGVCLTTAFAMHSWCAAIRGVEGGGLILDLPCWTFITDEGEKAMKCPVEIAITDRREKELADLGFMPLVHCKNTEYAAFFTANSCHQPPMYDDAGAKANARLEVQLPYIMTTSRFAHYLKALTRDRVGSFFSRGECERFLNGWISKYVSTDDHGSPTVKAQFPLRDARIEVVENREQPGAYVAVAFLRPHFQLDELSVSLRLVVQLPLMTH
jgi:type VI secretion system protein ImpC